MCISVWWLLASAFVIVALIALLVFVVISVPTFRI